MSVKIAEKLLWLEEYVTLAQTVVPKIKKLKSIKLLSPQEKKINRIHGQLVKYPEGHYVMSLYLESNHIKRLYPKPILKTYIYSKVDILSTLAHELAHLEHWDHTPQHKMLEAKLTMLFMAKLAENGYISEENEYSNRRTINDSKGTY